MPAALDVDAVATASTYPVRSECPWTCSSRGTTEARRHLPRFLQEEVGAAHCVLPVLVGETLAVVRERRTEEFPDGGSLGVVRRVAGTWRIATSGVAMAGRLPDWTGGPSPPRIARRLDGRLLGPSVGTCRAVRAPLHLRRGERSPIAGHSP